jgi:hypothetical protein
LKKEERTEKYGLEIKKRIRKGPLPKYTRGMGKHQKSDKGSCK